MATAALLCLLMLPAQEPAQDPGRPVLRRGGPAKKTEPAPELRPTTPPVKEIVVDEQGRAEQVVESKPAAEASLIERAREAAYHFTDTLPNYICDQFVTRYESKTLTPKWKIEDRFQLDLIYFGGKEDYRNIRRNGKLLKKDGPEKTGAWSTGEFGTILLDVFATNTAASFKFRGPSSSAALPARVYDYAVQQPNSHWTITIGYNYKPAYKGAVWIDPESARVLRVELNTRQLPADYQVDTVEAAVDYGWVTISGQRYLLPTKAEVLSCHRGTFICDRNEIEFRNYRKFQVESQVLQVESEVTFPEKDR